MQNSTLVRRSHTGDQLPRQLKRLFIREISDTFDERSKVLSIDVFHREKVLSVELGNVVNAADVGMGQLSSNADFGEETFKSQRIGSQRPRKKLQRHSLTQLQIVGPVHFSMPPRPRSPMIRCRSIRIAPGVNPPPEIE